VVPFLGGGKRRRGKERKDGGEIAWESLWETEDGWWIRTGEIWVCDNCDRGGGGESGVNEQGSEDVVDGVE